MYRHLLAVYSSVLYARKRRCHIADLLFVEAVTMNKTEHLLTCLIEECSEIQKAAAKALRFGLDDHAPDDSTTNSESISREAIDLIAIIEMLEERNIIPSLRTSELIQLKKDKVIRYMKYAQERGTLDAD